MMIWFVHTSGCVNDQLMKFDSAATVVLLPTPSSSIAIIFHQMISWQYDWLLFWAQNCINYCCTLWCYCEATQKFSDLVWYKVCSLLVHPSETCLRWVWVLWNVFRVEFVVCIIRCVFVIVYFQTAVCIPLLVLLWQFNRRMIGRVTMLCTQTKSLSIQFCCRHVIFHSRGSSTVAWWRRSYQLQKTLGVIDRQNWGQA